MLSRKGETPEIKQWKQQNRIITRKLEDSEKTFIKLFTSFLSSNPEKAEKTGKLISDFEHNSSKLGKQSGLIYGRLKKINQNVNQLKETLKYFDKTNQSLLKVQKLSEGIFQKMQGMKADMANSYDELDALEQKYTADLDLYERRFQSGFEHDGEENLEVINLQKQHKNKQNLFRNNRQKMPPKWQQSGREEEHETNGKSKIEIIEERMKEKETEVELIDSQIRDLGKNLGWHEEDHKDFITIWNRCHPQKNYFQIQDELSEYFKVYTNEQIQDHMNKYVKMKKLQEKKKEKIAEYKSLKEEKKEQQILILQSNEYEVEKKKRKQQQMIKFEEQQIEMKGKVENWKKKKQQEKLLQKKRMEEQQKIRKRQQINRRREEQMKRKQILEKWKQQKQQEEVKKQKQSVRRPVSALNKETRERIRERQQALMKQKMEMAIQKKMEREEMQKKAQKLKQQKLLKYAHVGSKLEEKTTAIKEKQRQKFDGKEKKDANTFGGQLLMTGIRAVPSWRQGL